MAHGTNCCVLFVKIILCSTTTILRFKTGFETILGFVLVSRFFLLGGRLSGPDFWSFGAGDVCGTQNTQHYYVELQVLLLLKIGKLIFF